MSLSVRSLLWSVQFRGKKRLFDLFLPNEGTREASVFGFDTQLDISDWVQRNVYIGSYEPGETATIRSMLRPGMTFSDVGANIGYFSLLASSRVGANGRVIAVEPTPALADHLRRTIERNNIQNIELQQCGLSESDGDGAIYLPPEHLHNNTPSMLGEAEGTRVAVQLRSLDGLLDSLGVGRVDFMKMDVEGFEAKVIAGASESLSRKRIRAILIEFNDYWLREAGSSPQELHETICSFGYQSRQPIHFFDDCVVNGLYLAVD